MFEKLENRAILEYSIVTQSDLHIGGHNTIEPAEVDNPVIKNSEGYPIIPGSSLKGVLRSDTERLLRGLNVDVCDVFDRDKQGGCNECSVCMLFGGRDVASSIRIKDATAEIRKTLVRDHVAIKRKERIQGKKYDTEAVPKGVRFTGIITIENIGINAEKFEKLGALLSVIDFFNACNGNIGHAASRGFGQVEIKVDKINVVNAQDYLDGNYHGKEYVKESPEYDKLKSNAVQDWKEYLESMRGANE